MSATSDQTGVPNPSVGQLFAGFFGISIIGFGGVIPWARWMIVERRGWLTPAEFNEVMALSQMLPGGNVLNMAVVIGHRFQGFAGAVAGSLGLVAGPFAIVIGLASIYRRIGTMDGVSSTLEAVSAAAIGLIIAMTVKMIATLKDEPVALVFAACAFLAVGILRLPLLASLAILGSASIAYAWWRLSRLRP